MMSFREQLKLIRKDRGITQEEMAERLDMSLSQYSKIETGAKGGNPSLDTLEKIAEILESRLILTL